MKKITLIIFIALIKTISYAQSINGKAVNNWDECVSITETEFKSTCLGEDREKGWLAAHATITNNCEQRIRVVWEYRGRMREGRSASKESTSRDFYLKPNESEKVYTCNTIANQGSIHIISVESADSNYTPTVKAQNSSSWDENKSLLSDESKNYAKNGVTIPKESIYEKRRKQAEAKYDREERERLETNRKIQELERQTQRNIDNVNRTYDQAVSNVKSAIRKAFNTSKPKGKSEGYKEWLEEERRLEKEERIEAEKRRERDAIVEEQMRKENAAYDFLKNIKDNGIPLTYHNETAYFILISEYYIEGDFKIGRIKFSKFKLNLNLKNQLPKKSNVISKFYRENPGTEDRKITIKGPFASKEEQEEAYNRLKYSAESNYVKVHEVVDFSYDFKAIAKAHFEKAQKAYNTKSDASYKFSKNLNKAIKLLGDTNADIEALFIKSYMNQDLTKVVEEHFKKYFKAADKTHKDYVEIQTLYNKVKEQYRKEADKVKAYEYMPPKIAGCFQTIPEELKKCLNKRVKRSTIRYFDAEIVNELGLVPGRKFISVTITVDVDGNHSVNVKAPHPKLEEEVKRVVNTKIRFLSPALEFGKPIEYKISYPLTIYVE